MNIENKITDEAPTPLGCRPADLAWVKAAVEESATSFAGGMRILPPPRRYGMYGLYTFCRTVDDIADGPLSPKEKETKLKHWKERIAFLYNDRTDRSDDILERVLVRIINFFSPKKEDFDAIIDGMMMDVHPIIAPSEKELALYCDRVACAVGRISINIFGEPTEYGLKVAHHLGLALQITNILRDLPEDAARGRLYLPAPLLERLGIPKDPIKAIESPDLTSAALIMAARARDHFREAYQAMKHCNQRAILPARIMGARYESILHLLCKRRWHIRDIRKTPRPSITDMLYSFICSYFS